MFAEILADFDPATGHYYAVPLSNGDPIGPDGLVGGSYHEWDDSQTLPGTYLLEDVAGTQYGSWPVGSYLGLRFPTGTAGDYYYGWFAVDAVPVYSGGVLQTYAVTLRDPAYNNIPNEPIGAGDGAPVPEPSSIMLIMAAMFSAVPVFRRLRNNALAA